MKKNTLEKDLVQLARIALKGRAQDVETLLYRLIKREREGMPELSAQLADLLKKSPTRSSPLRKAPEKIMPVDADSRFQLMRVEQEPILDHEPIYDANTQNLLDRIVEERENVTKLLTSGLEPTRTAILTGPPGVGKTLAARWLARELERPLLVLDLSSVMSSYLGRTGSNLRHVLEYAKSIDCVLLLDELDAVAKRRDDTAEIGELKRLVTVLIQQLDDWPSTGLLVAATNHSELLDPAIWRRFEMTIDFKIPNLQAATVFIESLLDDHISNPKKWSGLLAATLNGSSYSDIERDILSARRAAALRDEKIENHLLSILNGLDAPKDDLVNIAVLLTKNKLVSQRKASELK